ncbi:MAG TPA: ACT domain-containing protein [Terriglobia bacterium]|nr:ACT domain-containing protein [Terriglobia bacterium]
MKIHQLSLFLENKPSQLTEPCRLLGQAGINIRTLTLADTERFGILRFIVSDWEKGAHLLQEAGYVVNVTEVVAVEVPDRPGGLAELLGVFEQAGINIEYMYAFTFGRGDTAVMIFRFDDPDAAITRLQSAGINVVGSTDL